MSRQLSTVGRRSLTLKGLLVMAAAAVVIWLVLDHYFQQNMHHLMADAQRVLSVESSNQAGIRGGVRVDAQRMDRLGAQFLFSVREQRTLALLVFAGIFVIALFWLGVRVKRIHRSLEDYAQRLGFHMPTSRDGDSISRLENRVARISEEMIAETTALEYQARHDHLTNLPNRSLFMERLENELQASREHDEPFSLFVMDLDHFKEVNDTLGHHVGDRLLQEVARRLVSVLRHTDTVARLGGDEFAVLLPGADEQHSQAVCHLIIAAMDKPVKIENLCLRAAISIGVSQCPDHGEDANLLLRYADVAMYEAKRKHKGYAFYTSDNDDHSISRLGLSGELRDAIRDNQLTLDYQPMVDVKSGHIFCAEALVRWRHPEYGIIAPEEFIPSAEQTGVIRPLTLWVIEKALEQSAAWDRIGINLRISVNLSVRSLQDRKLPGQVEKLIERYNVDPKRVILEITESAIMSDPLSARRVMRRLSNMGFHLSIDDFGTGYSSLAYLKQLPVDEIKIDKSFVTRMDQDENDAVIVRATIDLAHNLGLKVVAEGVENTDVWDLLEMLGCDVIQGYYIRKPLAAVDLTKWIQSRSWEQEHWVTPMLAMQ